MPLTFGRNGVPPMWVDKTGARAIRSALDSKDAYGRNEPCLAIALVNNMPDSALEDTEFQFFQLLDLASGDTPVRVQLFSLPEVLRSEKAQQHVSKFYCNIEDLWGSRFDGAIITGTEPRQPKLRDEPYWSALTSIFDWAESNTSSTVLSCLAAHASVLHSDGIERRPLPDKQFGVFACEKNGEHPLTAKAPDFVRFPHSRWNEVREEDLISSGYLVLTKSKESGVDLFVKKKKKSLFVHFQGHPEYGELTLLKEYRRDVRRFLQQERPTYPNMPQGYFDATAKKLLEDFKTAVLSRLDESLTAEFPDREVAEGLQNSWLSSSVAIYKHWLQYIASKKPEMPEFRPLPAVGSITERKRSAVR